MKRVLAIVGGLLVLVLVLLLVLPLLFRDRIAERVPRTAANRNVNARVDWRDVGLSFFRHFPNLTLRSTTSPPSARAGSRATPSPRSATSGWRSTWPACSGTPWAAASRSSSAAVELDQPRLPLIALEDGTANWDITQEDAEAAQPQAASKPMAVSLRRFEINDAAVAFDNRQGQAQGDARRLRPVAQRRLQPEAGRDPDQGRRRHGERDLCRHSLPQPGQARSHRRRRRPTWPRRPTPSRTPSSGSTTSSSASPARPRSAGKLLGLDLAFKAPSTNFRSILSLVPAVYAHDFDKVKTSGTLRRRRPGQGRVRRQRLPLVRAQRQGEQRRLPVSRSPAPGARHLHGPGAHQSRRQRRQHGRQPRAASTCCSAANPVDATHGAADAGVRSRRGSHDEGQGGSGRRPPHGQARRDRPAHRHRRGRRGGADPDVVRSTRSSTTGSAASGTRGRRRPHASRARRCRIRSRSSRRRSRWRPERAQLTLVHRHDRQQRPPGVGLARQPALLRLPGRHPARAARRCGATSSTWTNGARARATCRSSRCRPRSTSGSTRRWPS